MLLCSHGGRSLRVKEPKQGNETNARVLQHSVEGNSALPVHHAHDRSTYRKDILPRHGSV
jgi:hypothetical protein